MINIIIIIRWILMIPIAYFALFVFAQLGFFIGSVFETLSMLNIDYYLEDFFGGTFAAIAFIFVAFKVSPIKTVFVKNILAVILNLPFVIYLILSLVMSLEIPIEYHDFIASCIMLVMSVILIFNKNKDNFITLKYD